MAIVAAVILREGDRSRLEALARSASARPSLSQRARIVLMAAEGLTNTEIARRTGSTRPTVINWRKRYVTGGINALGDLPRSGRPAVVDELEVMATTLADGGRPPAYLGVSYWSSRLLGQHLGISFATVSRIWRKWGIQPDHVETCAFGTDLQRRPDRQTTSDTKHDPHRGSSRSVESRPPRDRAPDHEPSADRIRDSKSVRAEFHGARGRRS